MVPLRRLVGLLHDSRMLAAQLEYSSLQCLACQLHGFLTYSGRSNTLILFGFGCEVRYGPNEVS